MRECRLLISVGFLVACADSNSGATRSSVALCTLDNEPPCGASMQSLTAAANEASAPSITAGITYAIAGPGAGTRGYVVFTPATSGTHTLYFGNGAPVRVCDEEAICSSAITSCGVLHQANQYAMTEGLPYVIELKPTSQSQPFNVHIVAPEDDPPPTGGAIKLAAAQFYSTGAGSRPELITLADLDGDSALDVVASTADDAGGNLWLDILEGHNDGTFTAVNRINTSAPGETQVADWSGDGIADIVGVAWDGQGPLPHFYLRGTGNFTYATSQQWLPNRELSRMLDVADFDEDGTLDLLAPESSGFVIVGMPSFTILQDETVFSDATWDAAAGDFNGDGHQDVLVGHRIEPLLRLYLGDGTGTVAFDRQIALPQPAGVGELAAFDLNGDGRSDFVAFNRPGGVATVGLSTASGFTMQLLPDAERGVAAADFDGDGRTDLVVSSSQQDALNFYVASDSGFQLADSMGFAACCLATADVNTDGRIDLVSNGPSSIAVYLGTP